MRRPGFLSGAWVGALLTAALAAVLFAAGGLAGAPFVPFDLFDWLARVLPGPVVTFGIDTIVDTITLLNLGAVAEVAKTAEQILALVIFLLAGVVIGGATFAVSSRRRGPSLRSATATGALVGALAFLVGLQVNATVQGAPLPSLAWLLVAFAGWGAALGWAHARLAATPARAPQASDPQGEKAGEGPTGAPGVNEGTLARLDRRRFLIRLGGATALVTVAGAGLGTYLRDEMPGPRGTDASGGGASGNGASGGGSAEVPWSQQNPLPNEGAEVAPAPGTRREFTPLAEHYRIDINMTPPRVDGNEWRLRVDGLVEEARTFGLEDLRAYPPMHQFVTLACISNRLGGDLIGTQRWTGVSMQRLLPDLGLRNEATHLRISSVDGFYEILAIEDILADERVMLSYAWDGLPLPQRNGFPLRVYIPDLYGMKQPKWIERIEAIDGWQEGYWVDRGWDAEARMHATSVIDTVATESRITDGEGPARIPVGGIAHAGARGISRVEVQVDDGPWQEARLRRPLSGTTWVVWRFDWPFEEGSHTFTVRCVDGNGEAQIEARNPVRPSGATGLLSEDVTL
ncbi:MAG: molybdopterin-dependent oxidoreductase [Trueperaceae bacterium]|nr:molybdopterin-dependent oxidoreductase [Trueperaceae bacterium]